MSDASASIAARKRALRRACRQARRALPPAQRAAETEATVAAVLAALRSAAWPPLAGYCAVGGELDCVGVHTAYWRRGAAVLLPRVAGPGHLVWHRVDRAADLRPGYRDIPEPDPERCPLSPLPLGLHLLVPGVAYTGNGLRLGQGGGFYDRLLARSTLHAIGVAFRCQLCASVPAADHDRSVDRLCVAGDWVR